MTAENWQVLVVEDEFDSAQMVSKILEHAGAHVTLVNNGLECLDTLETYEPHIVIMDLSMPKMDGWETLIKMRSNMDTAHIPVVAITAYYSDEVEKDANLAGFDAYFPKPLNPNTFVDQIAHLVP